MARIAARSNRRSRVLVERPDRVSVEPYARTFDGTRSGVFDGSAYAANIHALRELAERGVAAT